MDSASAMDTIQETSSFDQKAVTGGQSCRRATAEPLDRPIDHALISRHFMFGALIFATYGVGVCPFVESLDYWQLLVPIAMMFLALFGVRMVAWRFEVRNRPVANQVARMFVMDLVLFGAAGLALASWNFAVHGFPLESGGKIIVGMMCLGWFIAIDVALYNEHGIGQQLKEKGQHMRRSDDFHPLTRKFSTFALSSLTIIAIVLLLVVRKDMHWLAEQSATRSVADIQHLIVMEFMFVLVVMLGYMLRTIHSYSKNSQFFLGNQNDALQSVAEGDLDASVPVASNDEFGIMAQLTNDMIAELSRQKAEIRQTRDTTILALSSLAETRDNETGAHILRTQRYVRALCNHLCGSDRYAAVLTDETIELMYKSAPLHDIGKVGIPDRILLKPGRLTEDEFDIMKTHTRLGHDALETAERQLGGNSFLTIAKEIAATHHEKWDGSGYPKGLRGEDIPLSGRLMALADVYDALISKRVYKPAFSHEKAREIIIEGRGCHFDPALVDAFLDIEQEFIEIASRFSDG